jgi:hypothetical protein
MSSKRILFRGIACLALASIVSPATANDFAIAVQYSPATSFYWGVQIDGGEMLQNPPLLLIRGETYTFHITGLAPIHSFYINTFDTTGSAGEYTGGGLSDNGFSTDTPPGSPVTFTVPHDAPDVLYYNCGLHPSMAGMITVDGVFANGFESN